MMPEPGSPKTVKCWIRSRKRCFANTPSIRIGISGEPLVGDSPSMVRQGINRSRSAVREPDRPSVVMSRALVRKRGGDLSFVGLELVIGGGEGGCFCPWLFDLDDGEG